jgi:hypothetical protein
MSHSEVLSEESNAPIAKFCHVDASYGSPISKVNAGIIVGS